MVTPAYDKEGVPPNAPAGWSVRRGGGVADMAHKGEEVEDRGEEEEAEDKGEETGERGADVGGLAVVDAAGPPIGKKLKFGSKARKESWTADGLSVVENRRADLEDWRWGAVTGELGTKDSSAGPEASGPEGNIQWSLPPIGVLEVDESGVRLLDDGEGGQGVGLDVELVLVQTDPGMATCGGGPDVGKKELTGASSKISREGSLLGLG